LNVIFQQLIVTSDPIGGSGHWEDGVAGIVGYDPRIGSITIAFVIKEAGVKRKRLGSQKCHSLNLAVNVFKSLVTALFSPDAPWVVNRLTPDSVPMDKASPIQPLRQSIVVLR
jgi:hypothetical protein